MFRSPGCFIRGPNLTARRWEHNLGISSIMNRFAHLLLLAFVFRLAPATAAQPSSKKPFLAGAATSNITPHLGGTIVGGFVRFPATCIHDELHARCLVLDDGQTRLAVVVCDLLGIGRATDAEARKLVDAATGIPPERVLISCVHTHSACDARCAAPKDGRPVAGYDGFVARRIADGVKRAMNLLRPAELTFVTAAAPEHVFNRRWLMKPGTAPPNPFGTIDKVKMNPPGGSPDLVAPAGPTDPTISILAVREPQGRPIAVFATYSLHYVGGVGAGHISADYYGMFCRRLEQLFGAENLDPPFVAMMANGTSGDINNVNFRQPRPKLEPYVKMRRVADDVARKVFAAVNKARWGDRLTLAARYRELPVAARRPTPERMAWAKQKLAEPEAKKPGGADLPRIYAARTMASSRQPDTFPVPLHVLRIGDVCIGTMPAEVFCEIGLEFRERSPIKPAFMISLAHDYLGYLPTPRHFELGGYETWSVRLDPHASEKMLDELLEMAAEVAPPTAAQ